MIAINLGSRKPTNLTGAPNLYLMEPRHTIYGDDWLAARHRVHALPAALRPLFLSVLNHIEAGWFHIRELQLWYDANQERARAQQDNYALLLHFIDGDLVDLFRAIAAETAQLVPGYPDWKGQVDPGTIDGDVETFRRYLAVFAMAVEQEPHSESLREITRAAAEGLAGWCTELMVQVAAIDSAVIRGGS